MNDVERLFSGQHRRLPLPEQLELIKKIQAGNDEREGAEGVLVLSYERLLFGLAERMIRRQFPRSGLDRNDLIQEGNSVMIDAARGYDPKRGVPFPKLVVILAYRAMRRYAIANCGSIRIPESHFRHLQEMKTASEEGREPNLSPAVVKKTKRSPPVIPASLDLKISDNHGEGRRTLLDFVADMSFAPEPVMFRQIDWEEEREKVREITTKLPEVLGVDPNGDRRVRIAQRKIEGILRDTPVADAEIATDEKLSRAAVTWHWKAVREALRESLEEPSVVDEEGGTGGIRIQEFF